MSNPIDRKIPESIALGKMVHEARQKLGVLQRYVGDHIPQQQVVVYLPDNGRTKGLDRSRLPVSGDIRGELAEAFGNTGGDDNGDGNGDGGGE